MSHEVSHGVSHGVSRDGKQARVLQSFAFSCNSLYSLAFWEVDRVSQPSWEYRSLARIFGEEPCRAAGSVQGMPPETNGGPRELVNLPRLRQVAFTCLAS